MIDAKRIEEMKRLSAEASEGTWEINRNSDDNDFVTDIWVDGEDSGHIEIHGDTVASSINNAQFIAESRQFVPDIIAAYEAQAEEIDQLRLELRCSSTVQMEAIRKQTEEIAKLRKALTDIQTDCESAKERYIEESDIDSILETVREALK